MMEIKAQDNALSLRAQVTRLETQLLQRRQNVHTLTTETRQKFAAQFTSVGALLTATGIGVVIERAAHRKYWSMGNVLQVTTTGMGLLSLASSLQQKIESTNQPDR